MKKISVNFKAFIVLAVDENTNAYEALSRVVIVPELDPDVGTIREFRFDPLDIIEGGKNEAKTP